MTARRLWGEQNWHPGDRLALFAAVADAVSPIGAVLYAGSYIDVAASFVFDDVTYVDIDRRAREFFDDEETVQAIIAEHRGSGAARVRFIHGDFRDPLDVTGGSIDLLVSLYAGFVSEHCTRYLRVGGSLLVNPSHGDAAMASIDDRYELAGAVLHRGSRYRVATESLGDHLVPKRNVPITRASLHESGRGIAYTKPAFAYVFTRVR